MQSKCSRNPVKMQPKFSRNAAKMQPKCSQNAAKIHSKCSKTQLEYIQIAFKLQSKCSQNAVKMQPKFSQFLECLQTVQSVYKAKTPNLFSKKSPLFAKEFGYKGFMFIKILQGLCQGPIIPAVTVMISSWIPPQERSFSCSLIYGGQQLGSVISFSLSGVLADQLGWEWDFYFFAIVGLIFCAFWTCCVYSTPAVHPRITSKVHYISCI